MRRTARIVRVGVTSRILLGAAMLAAAFAAPPLSAGEPARFRAGAFAIDISPQEFPVSSAGSMSDRQATVVHDPLHARCLVLDDGTTRIAIVICDSCMIPRDLFDEAKEQASKKTGIPTERMLMAATHTHSAVTVSGVFQSEPELDYSKFLVRRIAEGVEKAAANLAPARVGWGAGTDASQVFNRRWLLKPGALAEDPFGNKIDRAKMNPGDHPDKDRPAGPIDPEIGLLSLQSKEGRPLALLANYSLHYVGGVPAEALSADYFGEFAIRSARLLGATKVEPAFVGIMSNGTSGDINNVNFSLKTRPRRDPFEQIGIVAESVAQNAHKAVQKIEHQEQATIAMRETEIELGVRLPDEEEVARAKQVLAEAGPPPYKTVQQIYARETVLMSALFRHAEGPSKVKVKLQAIRIGGLGIASTPCETFVETGLAIKQQSPLNPTFVVELANGYNGYLPTPEQHKLGGYETWRARSSYLAADAEPKIRQTLLKLLKEVAGEVQR